MQIMIITVALFIQKNVTHSCNPTVAHPVYSRDIDILGVALVCLQQGRTIEYSAQRRARWSLKAGSGERVAAGHPRKQPPIRTPEVAPS